MNRKTLAILGLAIGCGLVAMYGTGQMLNKKPKPVAMRDVVVAAQDLKVEQVLTPDAVRIVSMPANVAPAGAFARVKEIEGRWIQIPTLKDEPIVAAKLAPKDMPPGLISRIPAGKRAFAIEVNEQTGVSGFVLPDHRVDVVQDIPRDSGARKGAAQARTLLQNMLVLAVGQVFTRPDDKSLLARTVTLAVTPEEAEILTSAGSRGSLALTLRGLDDTEIVPVKPPIVEAEVEAKPEASKPAPRPEPQPAPPIVLAPPPPAPPVVTHRNIAIIHGVHRRHVLKVPIDHQPATPQRFATAPPFASVAPNGLAAAPSPSTPAASAPVHDATFPPG